MKNDERGEVHIRDLIGILVVLGLLGYVMLGMLG